MSRCYTAPSSTTGYPILLGELWCKVQFAGISRFRSKWFCVLSCLVVYQFMNLLHLARFNNVFLSAWRITIVVSKNCLECWSKHELFAFLWWTTHIPLGQATDDLIIFFHNPGGDKKLGFLSFEGRYHSWSFAAYIIYQLSIYSIKSLSRKITKISIEQHNWKRIETKSLTVRPPWSA